MKGVYSATDKVKPGFILGVGSGDPDGPWGGKGNVTKLRTAGFFLYYRGLGRFNYAG